MIGLITEWLDASGKVEKRSEDSDIGGTMRLGAQVCQLANIGYQLRRALRWDPAREEFVDDAAANRLRSRENRAPWDRI